MAKQQVRGKAVLVTLPFWDRVRVLLTGRLFITATGIKPYCEIYVATRLPRDAKERAQVVQAMKAVQDAARKSRTKPEVVEAPAADVRQKGAPQHPGRGVDRSAAAPRDARLERRTAVPVSGVSPVAPGAPADGGAATRVAPLHWPAGCERGQQHEGPCGLALMGGAQAAMVDGRTLCGACGHKRRAHREDAGVRWCNLCPQETRMHRFALEADGAAEPRPAVTGASTGGVE